MKSLDLGELSIARVIELDRWVFQAKDLFPEVTPDVLGEAQSWLDRRFIEADGALILNVHSYVIRTRHHTILVDTCNGNHKERPALPPHHRLDTRYLENLTAAGLGPRDVDIVLCTHLHPDHCGWNTQLVDGRWVPTFPNAKYLISKLDYEFVAGIRDSATGDPVMRDLIAMFEDSVLPVMAAGQAMLVDTDRVIDKELSGGVWLEGSPGHTPGHFVVHAKSRLGHAVMVGDNIHHPIQFANLEMPNGGDADPVRAREARRRLVETYADTSTYFLTGHFATPTFGRVIRHRGGFRFRWLQE